MASGIYKIINVVNNKFYVGSSVNLRTRKAKHFSELRHNKHNNRYLQNAWNKYGENSFIFVVVEELVDGADTLAAENVWLKQHVGNVYCYNIGTDATAPMLGMCGELSPTWGYKHTEESLIKIKLASTGRISSEEVNKAKTIHLIGKPKSAEVRAKISATLSGAGNPNFGKPRSNDFINKVRKEVYEVSTDTYYPSVKKAREKLNLTPPTITRALKSGKPISNGPNKGLQFRYVPTPYQCTKKSNKINLHE